MKRAVGVFAFIVENEKQASTAFVHGNGPIPTGPVEGSEHPFEAEEGVIGVMVPEMGYLPLFVLDIPDSGIYLSMLATYREFAEQGASSTGRRVEFVYFGPEGRQHLEWITP